MACPGNLQNTIQHVYNILFMNTKEFEVILKALEAVPEDQQSDHYKFVLQSVKGIAIAK
jgi:hypothetical protein